MLDWCYPQKLLYSFPTLIRRSFPSLVRLVVWWAIAFIALYGLQAEEIVVEGEVSPIVAKSESPLRTLAVPFEERTNHSISLGPLTLDERRQVANLSRARAIGIGIHRTSGESLHRNVVPGISWQRAGDKWRGTFTVTSQEAIGTRAQLKVESPQTLEVVFFEFDDLGSTAILDSMQFRPKPSTEGNAHQISSDLTKHVVWSPTASGSVLGVEIQTSSLRSTEQVSVTVLKVAHRVVSPAKAVSESRSLPQGNRPNVVLACEEEHVVCNQSSISGGVDNGAVLLSFEDSGSWVCSGILINDNSPGFIPYVVTAQHCIGSDSAASTVMSHWFYQLATCTLLASWDSRYIEVGGGAQLLETDASLDISLLRLNRSPPGGVTYAGWSTVRSDTSAGNLLYGIHHANGDVKKYFAGTSLGTVRVSLCNQDQSNCITYPDHLGIRLHKGLVKGGSSGAGVFNGTQLVAVHSGSDNNLHCIRNAFSVRLSNFSHQLTSHLITTTQPPTPPPPPNPNPNQPPQPIPPPTQPTTPVVVTPPEDDHGDTQETATVIESNSQISGYIETAGDVDYFEITIANESELTIATTGSTDTVCRIESIDRAALVNDDDGPDLNCLIETVRSTGKYWISVSAYADTTGTYLLEVLTKAIDVSDSRDSPQALVINTKTDSALHDEADSDYYSVTAPSDGTLHIYTRGDTDTIGCLWQTQANSKYEGWLCDDDSGQGRNFLLQTEVDEDSEYLFRVEGYEQSTGVYELNVHLVTHEDVGDQFENAAYIASSTTNWAFQTPGTLHNGDFDFYRVNLSSASSFAVETTGALNTRGSLFAESDLVNPIRESNSGGANQNFKVELDLESGTYYIVVERDGAFQDIDYNLHLSVTPVALNVMESLSRN